MRRLRFHGDRLALSIASFGRLNEVEGIDALGHMGIFLGRRLSVGTVDVERDRVSLVFRSFPSSWVDPCASRLPFGGWAAVCYAASIDLREWNGTRDEG